MERRKSKRIRATASVGYSVAGAVRPALTYDLSTHGCMIQSEGENLEAGDELELNFGDDLLVRGRVVWVQHRNAGIQFEAPLSIVAAKKILFNVVGTGPAACATGKFSSSSRSAFVPLLALVA